MIRLGTYPHPFTYPVISGLEAAGRVAAIGGVANIKIGDHIVGF